MSDEIIPHEDEAEILQPEPAQDRRLTKTELATLGMDALDRNRAGQMKVSISAGGVAFATAIEVMDFAKLMAISQTAVPRHLRNSPGMCLAVTFQAVEWRMSPFAVANKSYVVNDRIAYESQLVHGVIEARAPLRERLDCTYEGEGPERACTVIGKFRDGTQRTYTTPKFKDIRTKNSPLWKDDADQQQFYYGSRSWARKWCPDVLLGIYTKEEISEYPELAGEPDASSNPTLHARLAGADRTEGHQDGHVERELNNVASDAATAIKPAAKTAQDAPGEAKTTPAKGKGKAAAKKTTTADPPRTTTLAKPKETVSKAEAGQIADRAQALGDARARERAEKQKTDTPEPVPSTLKDCKDAASYMNYAMAWIDQSGDPEAALQRWNDELETRDKLTVRIPMRNALRSRLETKHGV